MLPAHHHCQSGGRGGRSSVREDVEPSGKPTLRTRSGNRASSAVFRARDSRKSIKHPGGPAVACLGDAGKGPLPNGFAAGGYPTAVPRAAPAPPRSRPSCRVPGPTGRRGPRRQPPRHGLPERSRPRRLRGPKDPRVPAVRPRLDPDAGNPGPERRRGPRVAATRRCPRPGRGGRPTAVARPP